MSTGFRLKLHHLFDESLEYKRNFNYGGRKKPADLCPTYDLSAIEKTMMETKVYKMCHNIKYIHQLSDNDAPFDGTYCTRSVAATGRKQLKSNDHRYQNL